MLFFPSTSSFSQQQFIIQHLTTERAICVQWYRIMSYIYYDVVIEKIDNVEYNRQTMNCIHVRNLYQVGVLWDLTVLKFKYVTFSIDIRGHSNLYTVIYIYNTWAYFLWENLIMNALQSVHIHSSNPCFFLFYHKLHVIWLYMYTILPIKQNSQTYWLALLVANVVDLAIDLIICVFFLQKTVCSMKPTLFRELRAIKIFRFAWGRALIAELPIYHWWFHFSLSPLFISFIGLL